MFIRTLRRLPFLQLFFATLAYFLGGGIARYLGYREKPLYFLMGLVASLMLLGSSSLFNDYFRLPFAIYESDQTPREREQYRVVLLQIAYAALTFACLAFFLLFYFRAFSGVTAFLMFLFFLVLFAYAIPPLQLSRMGYGEIISAIVIGTLIPSLSFVLQAGVFHRLVVFVTFPITLIGLAFFLATDFPTFATDLKYARSTLLIRLGWRYAIPIHHSLIVIAYLFFASAPLLQMPTKIIWPVLIALPFAIFQIYWLQRISRGGPPIWNLFYAISSSTFGFSIYLLTLTMWLR